MTYENPGDKKYDAWLQWNLTSQCNFDCAYCFGKTPVNKQELRTIKTAELLRTFERTGKVFRLGFTGGEPFLIPNFIEACIEITKDHFISINSNIILPNVNEFAYTINPAKVLFIQASFHPLQLKEKNLIAKYITNFKLLQKNNFNVIAEAVAYPPYESIINEYEILLNNNGIKLFKAPFIGKHLNINYPEGYSESEIDLFNIEKERIKYHYQKGKLCNAGYNAGVVYSNGDVYPCFQIKNKIGNVYEEINFKDEIGKCPSKFCGCPLNKYDPYLFNHSKN
ncbi:MAG: radical SAM protein [Ignavibacteria bacterium]|jgi:MoaA/NifB/PqqE/SkfB family radical SAM enzyme